MKLNNKGFSLIEILAVVVIIAILMMIAIPAISKIVDNNRKEVYVDNVINQMKEIQKVINSDDIYVYKEDVAYYIDYRLGTEGHQATSSPYAEWDTCYVVVTFDGKNNHFYWTGIDKAGWTIDLGKEIKNIKKGDIHHTDSQTIPTTDTLGKSRVVVYDLDSVS